MGHALSDCTVALLRAGGDGPLLRGVRKSQGQSPSRDGKERAQVMGLLRCSRTLRQLSLPQPKWQMKPSCSWLSCPGTGAQAAREPESNARTKQAAVIAFCPALNLPVRGYIQGAEILSRKGW